MRGGGGGGWGGHLTSSCLRRLSLLPSTTMLSREGGRATRVWPASAFASSSSTPTSLSFRAYLLPTSSLPPYWAGGGRVRVGGYRWEARGWKESRRSASHITTVPLQNKSTSNVVYTWGNGRTGVWRMITWKYSMVEVQSAHNCDIFIDSKGTVVTSADKDDIRHAESGVREVMKRKKDYTDGTWILVQVKRLKRHNLKGRDVSIGDNHVVIVDSNGRPWSWGHGREGQLGFDYSNEWEMSYAERSESLDNRKEREPLPIFHFEEKVEKVESSRYFSAAITEEGEVYTWGSGYDGQLGQGSTSTILTPHRVELPKGEKAKLMKTGSRYLAVVTDANRVLIWGRMAHTDPPPSHHHEGKWREIKGKWSEVKDIAAGNTHLVLLDDEGRPFSYGFGVSGELGLGDKQVTEYGKGEEIVLPGMQKVLKIGGRGCNSFFATADAVYGCGDTSRCQLSVNEATQNEEGKYGFTTIGTLRGEELISWSSSPFHTTAIFKPNQQRGKGKPPKLGGKNGEDKQPR
eukprot:CAMPEP_0113874508 /NCGR_PEP_ID=MMETSP0780_2-20120614/4375_1 /TAXON_ID=652834 /ORGANISM="Palpitomonas bilix" /LENGTH=516 /DNA_ID=CAMNT_0000860293 /DNA_START=390 /DNA_END=1940 /DNA_ORIENTATION=- /assembly_acc=CAM_ASM_000599